MIRLITLVMLGNLVSVSAYAAFFSWEYRAFQADGKNPPKDLTPVKDILNQHVPVPENGATHVGAGWTCIIQPESKIWSRTIRDNYMESRSIDCVHSSGAEESQVVTCHQDKKTHKTIRDSAEVNLKFKSDKLYLEMMCK